MKMISRLNLSSRLLIIGLLTYSISSAQNICVTALEQEVLMKINAHRQSKNLNELALSKTLMITANKNVENLVNKNYTILNPSQFGDYKDQTEYIRTSISGTTAADVMRTISTPSQYTSHSKILENSGDYANNNWETIGICIRNTGDAMVPTSIVIYFGEKKENNFQASICDTEHFFDLSTSSYKEPLKNPIVKFVAPDQVSVFPTYTDANGKRYEIDNGFDVFEKGERKGVYLSHPNAKYYEIFISTFIPTIVPQEDYIIKVFPNEVQDTIIKNVVLKGNTLEDVQEYLANGGKINIQDDRKYTMLLKAAWRNETEIVKYLLDNGADVNILSEYYESPLTFTSSEEVYDLLMEKNPKLDIPLDINSKYTLLHSFASNGLLKGVKYLVEEKKFNIEAKTTKNATPLFHAVTDNHIEVARYLIEKGAKQSEGWESYPIHEAAQKNYTDIAKLLIENGGKKHLNLLNGSGYSPLHYAIAENNFELVKLFIENGANVNLKNYYGKTPLAYCEISEEINTEIRDYLVSKGAK